MHMLLSKDITEDLIDAPVTILREYADQVGQDLSNRIIAEVHARNYTTFSDLRKNIYESIDQHTQIKPQPGPKFYFTFEIIAPPLDNYRYELFVISHDIQMYPTQFYLDEDILREIIPDQSNEPYGPLEVNDSDEMKSILDKIFNAPKTLTIIRALLSQMNGHHPNGAQN